jgi:hypothetical protein
MTENVGNRERLNWLLLEGVAIVISILLAFWIDAWWEGRKDRHEEQELLFGLEMEIADLRDRLEGYANFNRSGMQLIGQYLSDSVTEMDLRSVELAFRAASIGNVLDQGGALDALFASGRLERISDRSIRARLLKWPDWLDDIHTNDQSARGFSVNHIQPFLAENGFPRTYCTDGRLVCSESGPVPPEYIQLAQNSEFRALLMMRRSWMRVAVRDHENARSEADEILAMIRVQLAEFQN